MAFKDFDVPDYLKDAESFKVTKMSLADKLFKIKYKPKLKDVLTGEITIGEQTEIKLWITGDWDTDANQLKNKIGKRGFFSRNVDLLIKGFGVVYSGQAADHIAEIKSIRKRESEEAAKVQAVNSPDVDKGGKQNRPRVIEYYVQKYHNVWEGNELYESVLIGNDAYFVSIDRDYAVEKEDKGSAFRSRLVGGFSQSNAKDSTTTKILPKGLLSYINKPYIFESESEINYYLNRASKETLDTIYIKVKGLAKKYVDASGDTHHVILASDTLFTWFQDIFGQTHYLYFYGDNNSGKTINLQFLSLLGYRAMYDIDVTVANIYTYLGSVEEGQGIILEDEADGLDYKQEDKMRAYKKGYNSGGKVSRTETGGDSGRRQDGFYVYCFKAFSGERKLDPDYAKGFNERTFYLECQEGNPQYDLSEVVSPAGDEELEGLRQEIEDTRKLLLAFRLVNHTRDFPKIDVAVKNREKQLTKSLIRLFQNTKALPEIAKALGEMLSIRRGIKKNTLEHAIYQVVDEMIEAQKKANLRFPSSSAGVVESYEFAAKSIYANLREKLDGKYKNEDKDQSFDTSEHGLVAHKKINAICEDRFGARKRRAGNGGNFLKFAVARFEKVKKTYALEEKGIEIVVKKVDNKDSEKSSAGVQVQQVQQGSEHSCTENTQQTSNGNRTKMQEDEQNFEETEGESEESEESGEDENV